MSKLSKVFLHPSAIFLILVNMIPLLGALFFAWDVFTIMILYWMESAVVGFFNVLKMKRVNNNSFSALIPFFIVHYSIFMFVHLFLILQLFSPELGSAKEQFEAFAIVFKYFESLLIALSFIFFSHGLSFVFNFIKKQEYIGLTLGKQMIFPYKRILIMQVVVMLVGAGAVYGDYSKNISAIVFLVVFKIIFDLGAHILEHRKTIFA